MLHIYYSCYINKIMELFNDSIHSGLRKQTTIISFISVLDKKIKKNQNIIACKGVKHTIPILKLIVKYIPELYNINEISPEDWGYYLHPSFYDNARFDTLNTKLIDFTSHFYKIDILSIPIVFNKISNQSGID